MIIKLGPLPDALPDALADALPDALDPGFMAFPLVQRTRSVMLMVSA